MTSLTSTSRAPQRCFVMDLPGIFSSQKETKTRTLIRVMGTVVAMTNLPTENDNNSTAKDDNDNTTFYYEAVEEQDDWMLLQLDDGTGTISCFVPNKMMERMVALEVGHSLDCIGELRRDDDDNNQKLWIQADTLLEVPRNNHKDPTVAERLRWMEITQKDKVHWCGYPCPAVSSNDIFEIIDSNNGKGVTIADLALVMDLEPTQVQPLIEDLQLQGLIYQIETGFVPL